MSLPLSGLQSLVFDGKSHLYGVSPANNALVQMDASLNQVKVQVNAYDGDLGLQGASAVAVSPDQKFVYVAATAENSVAAFSTNGLREIALLTGISGLSNPRSITVSPDGQQVYVGGQTGLATLSRLSNGQIVYSSTIALSNVAQVRVSPDGNYVYALDDTGNHLTVLSRNSLGTLTVVQTLAEGSSGVTGLAGASDVVSSSDNQFVYVTAANDNSVAVFHRGPGGQIGRKFRVIQEAQAAHPRGFIGARHGLGLLDTTSGHYLVVAGFSEDALAVFQRDATTGLLTFVQTESAQQRRRRFWVTPTPTPSPSARTAPRSLSAARPARAPERVAWRSSPTSAASTSILPPNTNITYFTNMQGLKPCPLSARRRHHFAPLGPADKPQTDHRDGRRIQIPLP